MGFQISKVGFSEYLHNVLSGSYLETTIHPAGLYFSSIRMFVAHIQILSGIC